MMRWLGSVILVVNLFACSSGEAPKETTVSPYSTAGTVERLDLRINEYIAREAVIEVLDSGYNWTEGPVWLADEGYYVFSDVPENTVFAWQDGKGSWEWLKPSGYTGIVPRPGEMGSNGLTLDPQGELVLCQHGDRRVAKLDAPFSNPLPTFATVADHYEGKRFNSPNDVIFDHHGRMYFTDPPYGLINNMQDSSKEIPFQGIYRVDSPGEVVLLDTVSRPNGIALSPDERTLYIANSDPLKAVWYAYTLSENGEVSDKRIFMDVTDKVNVHNPGLPDGMKVHPSGTLFATGPGGVWLINAQGEPLGIIRTGQATANCSFNSDYSELFMTADGYIMRIKLETNLLKKRTQ